MPEHWDVKRLKTSATYWVSNVDKVVFLYASDGPRIEAAIAKSFEVVEKMSAVLPEEPERFGYHAMHFLVRLPKAASGARYDDLKNLVCEIQVRTVLQDAWATIAHHLSYKKEADVPTELLRKLNTLSGVFEMADGQFEQLRTDREKYAAKLKAGFASGSAVLLNRSLNLENLIEFLAWRLPDREQPDRVDASDLLTELRNVGCDSLREIDTALNRAEAAITAMEKKYPPSDEATGEEGRYTSAGAVRGAFDFTDSDYAKSRSRLGFQEMHAEFGHLVLRPE